MRIGLIYRQERSDLGDIYPQDAVGREDDYNFDLIAQILRSFNFEVVKIDIGDDPIAALKQADIDLAFNLCEEGIKGRVGLEPHIPALLDVLQIPYTGSDYNCIATCTDKVRAKEILSYYKVRTPKFQVFRTGLEKLNKKLTFPRFVKPAFEDGSIGIREDSVVHNEEELFKKIDAVHKTYKQPALVEEYIDGREISVGVIGNKQKIVLPPYEVCFENYPDKKPKIYSYEAKWMADTFEFKNTPIKCPAELPKSVEASMKRTALKVYDILQLHDYARIDFRIDKRGIPYILEVNPNPDISEVGELTKMFEVMGLSYDQAIYLIIKSALERYGIAKRKLPTKTNTQIQRSIKEYGQKE